MVENAIFDAAGNAADMTQDLRTVKLNDKDAPQITDLTLSTNNKILTVVMSEKVYSLTMERASLIPPHSYSAS